MPNQSVYYFRPAGSVIVSRSMAKYSVIGVFCIACA
jgi:hypothetical protein